MCKPTKNRHYCPSCGKVKMLFTSESKANNFLKFNAEQIYLETGKKPIRAYYCAACCGWHITSKRFIRRTDAENQIGQVEETGNTLVITNKTFCEQIDRRPMANIDLRKPKEKNTLNKYVTVIERHSLHCSTDAQRFNRCYFTLKM